MVADFCCPESGRGPLNSIPLDKSLVSECKQQAWVELKLSHPQSPQVYSLEFLQWYGPFTYSSHARGTFPYLKQSLGSCRGQTPSRA